MTASLPQLPLLSFEAHFRFRKGFPICFLGREREREKRRMLSKEERKKAADLLRKIFSDEKWQTAPRWGYHFATSSTGAEMAVIIQQCIRAGNAAIVSEWTKHFES